MGRRLFVSVDCDGLTEEIAAVQEAFEEASGVRPTDPSQAHVTIKFLGETADDRVDPIVDALEAAVADAGVGPFTASFGGLGVFPDIEYISVVWIGVREGGDAMTALHEAVEERTTAMGFEPEDHEFTPHATIARMDHAGGKELVQSVVRERDPDVGTVDVDELRLKESHLDGDGPTYETVATVSLPG